MFDLNVKHNSEKLGIKHTCPAQLSPAAANLSHVHQVRKDIVGLKGFEALTQAPTTSLHPRSQGSQVNNQTRLWHHTLAFCRFAAGNCKLHPVGNWRLTDYGMIRFFISQKFYGFQRHSFNQHSFRVCFKQKPVLPWKPETSKQVLATNLPVSPPSDADLWIEAKSDANQTILPRQQCWSRGTGGNWYLDDGWLNTGVQARNHPGHAVKTIMAKFNG